MADDPVTVEDVVVAAAARQAPQENRGWRRALGMAAVGALAVVVVAGGAWWIGGGRWQIVATPSMGQAAPVGAVVFTRPIDLAQVRVGQIVTFRPPTGSTVLHTHRVIAIDPDGAVHTRGDINGAADPWALRQRDVVGVVVTRWWGVGWLIRGIPLLALGGLLLWLPPRRFANQRWRGPVRLFGSSLLVCAVSATLRPFVRVQLLSTNADGGGIHVTVVSTGLLPIRVSTPGGDAADLADGQIGVVTGHPLHTADGLHLSTAVHLPPAGWLLLLAVWLTPLLVALIAGSPILEAPPADTGHSGDHGHNLNRPPPQQPPGGASPSTGAAAAQPGPPPPGNATRTRGGRTAFIMTIAAAAALMIPPTTAAINGQISNITDTAGSAPYFTCAAATRANNPFFTYPLADSTTSGASATDVSGNNRTGTYNGTFTTTAVKACNRDTGGSVTLTGTATYVSTPISVVNPTVFTAEIWFKTTTGGGRLIGFGNAATGTSSQYDRHLYLSNTGQVVFGVYNGAVNTVVSPLTYLDGKWHHTAATLSAAGMALYIDGVSVATNANTTAENFTGYWRIGYDTLNGWGATQPTNFYYTGALAWASVYTTALTATQIKNHYAAGT